MGEVVAVLVGIVVGVSLATLARLGATAWWEKRHKPKSNP